MSNFKDFHKVEGMHCQYGCANKVKSLMSELEGMKNCEVDFESSIMTVEYDDSKVNSELILSKILSLFLSKSGPFLFRGSKNHWPILTLG